MMSRQRRAALTVTAGALVFIAAETLVPHPENAALVARTPVWCILCGELGLLDILLNVILFVPLGVGLHLQGRSWRQALLLGAALSLGIETAQYFAIAGRDAALGDVLTNTAGAGLGAVLANSWRFWLRPARGAARRLAGTMAVVWLVQVGLTGLAVQPSLPHSVYWGQRAAELGQFDTFPGRLLDARVGAMSLPSRRLANSAMVRRALLEGEPVTAVVVPAGPTRGIAPLASIFDGDQREIAVLGQWDRDLVFRLRARALDWRLRPPAIRLRSVFAGTTPETLTVAGTVRGDSLIVTARGGASGPAFRAMPLSAQWGWSLLLPYEHAFGSEVGWLSALWVGGCMVPIGFWMAATGLRTGPAALAILVLLVLGLIALPALLGEQASTVEWAGALAGALAGWLLARATHGPVENRPNPTTGPVVSRER